MRKLGASGEGCGNVTPCDGDVVGKWQVVATCVPANPGPVLIEGTSPAVSSESTGTWEFRADGTVTIDVTGSVRENLTLDDACVAAQGAGPPYDAACAAFGSGLGTSTSSADGGSASGSCRHAAGACACSLSFDFSSGAGNSTYTLSGTALAAGTGEVYRYCRSGSSLHLSATAWGGPAGTAGAVASGGSTTCGGLHGH